LAMFLTSCQNDPSQNKPTPIEQLTIKYIGNAAFEITDSEISLMIDYPYQSGAFGFMDYQLDNIKPADDVLSLITHKHQDHWDPELFQQSDYALIAPPDILAETDTPKKIPFNNIMEYNGITIEAFEIPHGGQPVDFQHYSYLVTWHGLRIYIPGDAEPDKALTMKDIDIMLIPAWLAQPIVDGRLTFQAKKQIIFHQRPNQEIPEYPDYITMNQGEI
ncbi:MAG: hypothetical protein GY869_09220, partial [Planctomycetes bacterium]|nr:hypothetical protein [Planctomycetota bacterium]